MKLIRLWLARLLLLIARVIARLREHDVGKAVLAVVCILIATEVGGAAEYLTGVSLLGVAAFIVTLWAIYWLIGGARLADLAERLIPKGADSF